MTWLFMIAICTPAISVTCDILTYEMRQDEWEREHPDQVYVRNYRQLTRT